MKRKNTFLCLSVFLFFVFFAIGLCIAAHKPLWLDELHTQFLTIQHRPAWQVITQGGDDEGNSSPLYYVLQKWVIRVPGVQISPEVLRDYIWANPRAQLVLRINAIVFMSLALSIIYYFFASTFSTWAGAYALLCSLASPMVWLYWAEARPYPLVILLTVIQMVILTRIWKKPEKMESLWKWLAVVHGLLVATSYLSLLQVACAVGILVLYGHRARGRTLWLLAVPCLIAVFYRSVAAKLNYSLYFQWAYLTDNIPLDRVAFLALAMSLLLFDKPDRFFEEKGRSILKMIRPYAGFFFLCLAGIAFLCWIIHLHKNPVTEGLHSRFFIFLTPVGIMFQVLLAVELFRRYSKNLPILFCLILINLVLGTIAFMNTSLLVLKGLKYL